MDPWKNEISKLKTIHFQVRTVSLREGRWLNLLSFRVFVGEAQEGAEFQACRLSDAPLGHRGVWAAVIFHLDMSSQRAQGYPRINKKAVGMNKVKQWKKKLVV